MSKKRRTRKQKIKAQRRLTTQPISVDSNKQIAAEQPRRAKARLHGVMQPTQSWSFLFHYDPKLIYLDLLKSFIVTVLIFTLLLGIYFWLK